MSDEFRYIPIERPAHGRSYRFHVKLALNSNGHWQASIDTLPGCAVWGYTKDEAIETIAFAATHYVTALVHHGIEVADDPVVEADHCIVVTV